MKTYQRETPEKGSLAWRFDRAYERAFGGPAPRYCRRCGVKKDSHKGKHAADIRRYYRCP